MLTSYRTTVLPEWVDYNGHLRDAFYLLIFSHATDALMDQLGLDEAGRARSAQEEEQQNAVRRETERLEAAQQEAARQAAAQQEADRQTAARLEAERLSAEREQAAREETARQALAQVEATRAEAERQQAALQEAARVETARLEVERQGAARRKAAEVEAERQREAEREAAAREEAQAVHAQRVEHLLLAEADLALGPGRGSQQVGDRPLAHPGHPDGPCMHHRAGAQARCHILQHGRHDLRHARHDEDIADLEARRALHRVLHQAAALGHARHAAAGGVELALPAAFHHGDDLGMLVKRHAERLRHAVGGDVVVGRPKPTANNHRIGLLECRTQSRDNTTKIVTNFDLKKGVNASGSKLLAQP